MKIMYVEDNAVNLALIERIAQMNKHELISYDEAEKALVILEQGEKVDLILLDIQLAGEMDGIAFAKVVREKGWKQPIIAITAYAMMGDKERILAAGCNEYLPKPLPIAEFLALLAKYDPTLGGQIETPLAPITVAATVPPPIPAVPVIQETPTEPTRDVPSLAVPAAIPPIPVVAPAQTDTVSETPLPELPTAGASVESASSTEANPVEVQPSLVNDGSQAPTSVNQEVKNSS